MKTKNLTPFPFGTKVTSRLGKKPEMTLVLRACYSLAPDRLLELPGGGKFSAQGSMSAETFAEEDEERAGACVYPGDFADWKPRGEVMLRGTCHVPSKKPLTECPVRFEVGGWSKILRVVGRRFWSDDLASAVMSQPAPFTAMPLGYANAFGGPGYASNPVGKGFSARELPNVEHAGHVIRSRRDDLGPAGFGPINPIWPERAKKVGKEYGPRWRKERFPFYAEDFDFGYFNAAPADQQLPGYLRGDERLLFQNLHPDAQLFETRLPGLRVRAFVNDVKGRFREPVMNLDTLFADLDEGLLYLTWRGLDAVESDDLADVKTVLVASEELVGASLPAAHYREALARFEADPRGFAERERLGDAKLAAIEGMRVQLAEHQEGAGAAAPPAPANDPLTGRLSDLFSSAAGSFPGAAKMEQSLAAAVASATKTPAGADAFGKLVAALPPRQQLTVKPRPPAVFLRPGAAPPAWAAKAVDASFAKAEEARKKAAEIQRAEGQGSDEGRELLERLDEQLAKMQSDPFLQDVRRRPPPREPAPGADLSEQDYGDRDLAGADLRGANLRNANLAGCNLEGARLSGACLDGAVLVAANLTGADLTGADLTYCNLSGVLASGATLRQVNLTRAWLKDAILDGAVLAGARGEHTFLPRCDLSGADARGLSLDRAFARKAVLARADFSEASLTRSYFLDVDATEATFARAQLAGSSFAKSDLSSAVFQEARGDRTIWLKTILHETSFGRALLPNAMFIDASGTATIFRRAFLREARFYRAALEDADFTECNLVGADLTKARLSRSQFRGANLFDAKLRQAAGEACDFTGANLKRALLEEA